MGNDSEIWERFKAGDQSALSHIYTEYFDSLMLYGLKFIKEPTCVKDCIQDVFFQLIKAGNKLGTTGNIRFYLFKALKNVLIKEMEKGKKEGLVILNFDVPFSLEEEWNEKENVTEKEKALLKALNQLSPRQKEIIYLRFECGMDYDHICDIMHLKYDSARKLVLRTIQNLKSIIEGETKIPLLFFIRFSEKML